MTSPRLLPVVLALVLAPGCVIVSDEDLAAQKDRDGDGVDFTVDCDDDDADVGADREWTVDNDGDGFAGDAVVVACRRPAGFTEQVGDCDDNNPLAFPGAPDAPYDGVDADCAGADVNADGVEDDWDVDGDGEAALPEGMDCDDGDALVNTDALEMCDGVDNDCDGALDADDADLDPADYVIGYPDDDGDGYGVDDLGEATCTLPDGYSERGGDCDDASDAVHPDAVELCNLGIDDDCDGLIDARDPDVDASSAPSWYADNDRDGFGVGESLGVFCEAPSVATAPVDGDCNDGLPGINPGAVEVCDEADNDCDGATDDADPDLDPTTRRAFYEDLDGDMFGNTTRSDFACVAPPGFVEADGDCADGDPSRNPGATEVCNVGVDDDCDGVADDADGSLLASSRSRYFADRDTDGFGDGASAVEACAAPVGFVSSASDCDDSEAAAYPGATEVCEDGLDNDCDARTAPCGRGVFALSESARAVYTGTGSASVGSALARVSDQDADGLDDLWVGAPDADVYDINDGAAYLLAGGGAGGDTPSMAARSLIYDPGSRTGCSLASGGDFDGDGNEDLAVGVCGRSSSYADEGGAVVVPAAAGAAMFLVEGGSTNRTAGSSLHLIPDLNADGKDELLIGGPTNSTGSNQGMVWLIMGGQSGTQTASAASAMGWLGETTGDRLGNSAGAHGVSSVDFDGDGLSEALIGAVAAGGSFDPGRVYVVAGDTLLAGGGGTRSAGTADLVMRGVSSAQGFGATVRGLGDVNADGYGDFAVAAPVAGQVFVVFGLSRIPSLLTSSGRDLELFGVSDLGGDLAAADLDGDGVMDLVSSAPNAATAFVSYGPLPRGSLDVAVAGLQLVAPGGQRLGESIALVDDDGDGDLDIALSTDGADGRSGGVYIWQTIGL